MGTSVGASPSGPSTKTPPSPPSSAPSPPPPPPLPGLPSLQPSLYCVTVWLWPVYPSAYCDSPMCLRLSVCPSVCLCMRGAFFAVVPTAGPSVSAGPLSNLILCCCPSSCCFRSLPAYPVRMAARQGGACDCRVYIIVLVLQANHH